ncbi:MAG: 2-isopropylmalate synthase [Proteobacteria bacterium]|nr:2-isopropylmalate synthase [Pseudomonadota bacterium]
MDKLIIFDTTLRDGEQSAGAAMTATEKLKIALQLERLQVDVIEAGFPIASRGDFNAVNTIAQNIKDSTVCGLARANEKDITAACEAIAPAKRKRLHTFIATSSIHMQKKLNMQPDEVLAAAVAAVKFAGRYTDDIEFSPEDAGRSDEDFLCRIIEAAIDAGATTINIPDTVGYTMPHQFGAMVGRLIERIPNADKVIFSVHCHNDLGCAVANSLSAVLAGARQVEGTINGIGERAGNTALEEVIMAVRTRRDVFACDTRVDARQLVPTSKMISTITGFPVQPNKAIVGVNAFAHESGIHQDGVLKNKETYEIMSAEDVGWASNLIRLGKLSGRNAFRTHMKELGIQFADDAGLNEVFGRFKDLADKKRDIYDEDLLALVGAGSEIDHSYQLESFQFTNSSDGKPHARIQWRANNKQYDAEADGDGMVDAAIRAVEKDANSHAALALYSVNNITDGSDSQGSVTVRLARDGVEATGHGTDTDIIVASVKAYIHALARLEQAEIKAHPQL